MRVKSIGFGIAYRIVFNYPLEMQFYRIFVCTFMAIFFGISLSLIAEPFVAPDDPFIRHEIRLLGDEGGLDSLHNTWPLDLGGLSAMRSDTGIFFQTRLLDNRLSQEANSGWSPIFTTIGFADDRVTARGFGPEPRSSFATNASVSWMNDRFAAKLSLNALYGIPFLMQDSDREARAWRSRCPWPPPRRERRGHACVPLARRTVARGLPGSQGGSPTA